jgi:hypothetical protein
LSAQPFRNTEDRLRGQFFTGICRPSGRNLVRQATGALPCLRWNQPPFADFEISLGDRPQFADPNLVYLLVGVRVRLVDKTQMRPVHVALMLRVTRLDVAD